ncbi:exocyst complex component 3-like protein 2 [Amia ocellicauda]|uniref:exocyst complex component 3-like protein 2 n=1 Tax=Amia ocellicauda TaxID=2972642 RepID=UPI003463F701
MTILRDQCLAKKLWKLVARRRPSEAPEEIEPLLGAGYRRTSTPPRVKEQVQAYLREGHLREACQCIQEAERQQTGAVPVSDLYQDVSRQLWDIVSGVLCGETTGLDNMPAAIKALQWGQTYSPVQRRGKAEPLWMPQNWQQQFEKLVEQSVSKIIPGLPDQDMERGLGGHLRCLQDCVPQHLCQLAPFLRPAQLLGCVTLSFQVQILQQLEQVLHRSPSVSEGFLLLHWALHDYSSESFMGHPDIRDQSVTDKLLLVQWTHRVEEKLLEAIEIELPTSLARILQNEQETEDSRPSDEEEEFLKLQVDLTQVINSFLTEAEKVSRSLKPKVQRICSRQLLCFTERYQESVVEYINSKQREDCRSRRVRLFRIFGNCHYLKEYLETITEGKEDIKILKASLEKTEAQAKELILEEPLRKAKSLLKTYIKKGDGHLDDLMPRLMEEYESLPVRGQLAHQIVLDSAYERLCFLYLRVLLKSDRRRLHQRWGDVEGRVEQDAASLHASFSRMNPGGRQWNSVLLKGSGVLKLDDVEALKISCTVLIYETPEVSEELIKRLLQWGARLSSQQVQSVLETCQEVMVQVSGYPDPPRPSRWFCCCPWAR